MLGIVFLTPAWDIERMKKFKFPVFVIVVFVCFSILIPASASAAWWNPISWFNKSDRNEGRVEQIDPSLKEMDNTDTQQESNSNPSTEPKVVEKIRTEVIKIDNPALQARIDELVKQNLELNSKINSYISSLNECREEVSSKPVALTEEEIRGEKLAEIDEQILSVIEQYLSVSTSDNIVFNDGRTHAQYNSDSFGTINTLLNSYRIADKGRLAYENLPRNVKTLKEGRAHVLDLKNYLINSYMRYR